MSGQLISALLSSAPFGEPFIILLASLAILGIMDIIGLERINIKYIMLFSAIFFAIFLYNINFDISKFIASSTSISLIEIFGSMIVLLLFPGIGLGDKLFMVFTFLIYPFWLMWAIIILALILTRPAFKAVSVFIKNGTIAVPFYPFLFLSAAIIFAFALIFS